MARKVSVFKQIKISLIVGLGALTAFAGYKFWRLQTEPESLVLNPYSATDGLDNRKSNGESDFGRIVAKSPQTLRSRSKKLERLETGVTHLSFTLIEKLLQQDNCGTDDQSFLACVAILDRALDYHGKGFEIVPGDLQSIDQFLNLLVKDFGGVHIRHRIESSVSNLQELMRVEKQKQFERYDKWLQIRQNNNKFSFLPIWSWMRSEIPELSNDPAVVANLFNAYLSVMEDANSQIVSTKALTSQIGHKNESQFSYGLQIRRLGSHYYIHQISADGFDVEPGVKPLDILVSINTETLSNKSLKYVMDQFSTSQPLNLVVLRDRKYVEVKLRPENHHMPESVIGEMTSATGGKIRIDRFSKGSCALVERFLKQNIKMEKLLLDLRSNHGGDIEEAVCLMSLFIAPDTEVASIIPLEGEEADARIWKTQSHEVLYANELEVEIDGFTASVAELVAQTVKSTRRGVVVGQRSYGKGSVQKTISLDPSCLSQCFVWLRTMGTILSANKVSWHLKGVRPDRTNEGLSESAIFRLSESPLNWVHQYLKMKAQIAKNSSEQSLQ